MTLFESQQRARATRVGNIDSTEDSSPPWTIVQPCLETLGLSIDTFGEGNIHVGLTL